MQKKQMQAMKEEAGGESSESEDEDVAAPNSNSNKVFSNAKYIITESGQYERIVRKRKRKSSEQLRTLMREFEKNPNWSKETLLEISKKSGLSEA